MDNQSDSTAIVQESSGAMEPFQTPAMATQETSVTAVAAQAKAAVEARFLVALHRPRDVDVVRSRLLKDCRRPRFAEVARYKRPVGKKRENGRWVDAYAEGPSIRFAEAALRHMGNLDVTNPTIYDDSEKMIVRVTVTDLETNATLSKDILIQKTVERRSLKKDQKPLGSRLNSFGEMVYLVQATEADIKVKEAALVSKVLRTLVCRLVPGDILDEAMELCIQTQLNRASEDPDAARKRIADGFDKLGISPDELKRYLGHELSTCSPAEVVDLRELYTSIKDGMTTWSDVMRDRVDAEAEAEAKRDESTQAQKVKADIAAKAAAKSENGG